MLNYVMLTLNFFSRILGRAKRKKTKLHKKTAADITMPNNSNVLIFNLI